MRTAHRLQSLAKRNQRYTGPLPKFWRPSVTASQQLDCKLIHWDLIDRFTNGTATPEDLWDWMETGYTYSQIMRLLADSGVEFTGEAMAAIWSAERMARVRALHGQGVAA